MTQLSNLKVGTKVSGLYHDVPYVGTIAESRVDTAAFKYLLTVDLDAPIKAYGKSRDRIHFSDKDFVTVAAAAPAAAPLNHAVFETAADVAFHYHGKRPA